LRREAGGKNSRRRGRFYSGAAADGAPPPDSPYFLPPAPGDSRHLPPLNWRLFQRFLKRGGAVALSFPPCSAFRLLPGAGRRSYSPPLAANLAPLPRIPRRHFGRPAPLSTIC